MKLHSVLDKRLATYGSMSLALAAVAAPQAAKANVVSYFGPSVTDSVGSDIYFNLLTGTLDASPVAGDFQLVDSSSHLARISVVDSAHVSAKFAASLVDFSESSPGSSAARLVQNALIGGVGMKFSTLNGTLAQATLVPSANFYPFGHFNSPDGGDVSGYLGLEVLQNGTPEYGWADLVVHSDYTVTLNSFALDPSGAPIEAGVGTPEPSSVLLLAMGAAGVALYRRKRKT